MRNKRYFKTKTVTPRLVKNFAGSRPSELNTMFKKPPPGHATTAVPFAISFGG